MYALLPQKELVWFRPDCGLWSCTECGIKNKGRWALRVGHGVETYKTLGHTFYFMTLTSHEKLKTFDSTLAVWSLAWPKLYARMKRQKADLKYASVPEKHGDGRWHMHLLINHGFDLKLNRKGKWDSRWLHDNPRECGLGYMNDVQPIRDSRLAAWYVTKYVSKALSENQWPRYLRRVRVSNNWPELPPSGDFEPIEANWQVVMSKSQIQAVLRIQEASGYRIRALKPQDKTELMDNN
jgi:hypothetical protein